MIGGFDTLIASSDFGPSDDMPTMKPSPKSRTGNGKLEKHVKSSLKFRQ